MADTTVPASDASQSRRGADELAVVWVYPEAFSRITPLGDETVLGRDEDCDIQLVDGQASRRHARITRSAGRYLLEDQGSTNGTFVDGRAIQEQEITIGSVIRLGKSVGVVRAPWDLGYVSRAGHWFFERAPGLLGGPTLGTALEPARQAAKAQLDVVLEGETGSGKEWVARAIHAWSECDGPFIAVNCAALPTSLAEAELFGHAKGAFTGAERSSPGLLRSANGGTLLLDEVIDLPLAIQAKLLRVLEERTVTALGTQRPEKLELRVIAAAQKPLSEAVEAGDFRADLYARLDGMTVRLPSLRQRSEDVPSLLRCLLEQEGASPVPEPDARLVERLCCYTWPRNVRELRQLARRIVATHDGKDEVGVGCLPDGIKNFTRQNTKRPGPARSPEEPISDGTGSGPSGQRGRDLERLVSVLRENGGNVAQAASALKMSRQRAYRLLKSAEGIDLGEMRATAPEIDPNRLN